MRFLDLVFLRSADGPENPCYGVQACLVNFALHSQCECWNCVKVKQCYLNLLSLKRVKKNFQEKRFHFKFLGNCEITGTLLLFHGTVFSIFSPLWPLLYKGTRFQKQTLRFQNSHFLCINNLLSLILHLLTNRSFLTNCI